MMTSRKRIALDKAAIKMFCGKEQQSIAIPKSIKEEYRLNEKEKTLFEIQPHISRRRKTDTVDLVTPEQQYADAHGYVFSWGHILERRVNQFVIWDFCLTHLLSRYLSRGLRLRHLQRIVFAEIEAELDCTSRDPAMAVALIGGWAIYPGTAVGAITQVVHFTSESEARDWTAQILIDKVLPKAIARARKYVDSPGH